MARPQRIVDDLSTRERLLRGAESVFAQKGLYGASLRDIGAATGLSNASMLHHFPSKGALYAAVLDRIADSLDGLAGRIGRATPGEVLSRLYTATFDWMMGNRDHALILMREVTDNEARAEHVESWVLAPAMTRMGALIAEAQAQGHAAPGDPQILLFLIIGAVSYASVGLPTIAGVLGTSQGDLAKRFRADGLALLKQGFERTP
jgi:AcrR family transcriptional regulator